MTHRIQLYNSELYTLVDEDTYHKYKDVKLYINGTSYVQFYCNVTQRTRTLHRALVNTQLKDVDHVNGDKLDNRRVNLRACTRAQNQRNRARYKTGRERYKGVVTLPSGRYNVQLHHASRKSSPRRGTFDSIFAAVIYYNLLVNDEHGEFARPNSLYNLHELYYPELVH